MLIKIYDVNPSERELRKVIDALEHDGLIIYPTDSIYAIGCSIQSSKGIEQLKRIKDGGEHSLIFENLAQIASYCRVDNETFKILKRNLPGPFTFILKASSRLPAKTLSKRKTIGARIPDNAITHSIVEALGVPLASVSVRDDEVPEYMTDPELLHERYSSEVDIVVDGGIGQDIPSAVVDLTEDEPVILREGAIELE